MKVGPRRRALGLAILLMLGSLVWPDLVRFLAPTQASSAAWQAEWEGYPDGHKFIFHRAPNPCVARGDARDRIGEPPEQWGGLDPWGNPWWLQVEIRPDGQETRAWTHVISAGPDGVFEGGEGDDVRPRGLGEHGYPEELVRCAPLLLFTLGCLIAWAGSIRREVPGRRRGAALIALGACWGHVGLLVTAVGAAWLLGAPRLLKARWSRALEVEVLRALGIGLPPAIVVGLMVRALDLGVASHGQSTLVSTNAAAGITAGALVLIAAMLVRAKPRADGLDDSFATEPRSTSEEDDVGARDPEA